MADRDPHKDPHDHQLNMMRPESAPEGNATPANVKSDAENVGEGAGTFLGGVGGLAIGAAGGPVGMVVGAVAGAVGGWWAGKGVADAFTSKDDAAYRAHYEGSRDRLADRSYEQVAPAYVAGHLAGRNPDYVGRSFEQVEADLQCGWHGDVAKRCGDWPAVRGYARHAFDRARAM
jgi:hypothetical protein